MTSPRPASPPPRLSRAFALAALSCLAVGALGCQPQVGDPCVRASDCGLNVIRQCDMSNAPRSPDDKGECIVENCSYGVCPKEAVCVKVYASEFLSLACDPETEDQLTSEAATDVCLPNEVCLPEGLCADEIRARTSCRRECKADKDCRDGYQCIETGLSGIYVAPDPDAPELQRTAKICVPK